MGVTKNMGGESLSDGTADGRVANPALFIRYHCSKRIQWPYDAAKQIARDYEVTGNSLQIAVGQLQNEQQRGHLSGAEAKYFKEVIAVLQETGKKGFAVAAAHKRFRDITSYGDKSLGMCPIWSRPPVVVNELSNFYYEANKWDKYPQEAIDALRKELDNKRGFLPKEAEYFAAIIKSLESH